MTSRIVCRLGYDCDDWPKDLETLADDCLAASLEIVPAKLAGPGEISVLLTSDEAQRHLNARWRKIDRPTNVLSFPAVEPGAPLRGLIGDISLAFETVEREARLASIPFRHHFAHLLVHGFLHILGYDHARPAEADRMQALETRILGRLSIPDPYAAESVSADTG
jgi:probable rRNA maturation factor